MEKKNKKVAAKEKSRTIPSQRSPSYGTLKAEEEKSQKREMGVYGEKGMSCPRVEYSYTYQTPPGGREGQEESLEIKLRCPRISSFRWCLKLYSLVLAALGLLLSFIWVCFQVNTSTPIPLPFPIRRGAQFEAPVFSAAFCLIHPIRLFI